SLNTSNGVLNPRHFRGLLFKIFSTISTSSCVIVEKSNFLGKNSLISPFVFSFVPLCYELYGSAKYTLTFKVLSKSK
ncbi:hypothetical protein, partial [Paraclostridium bifermentans]|uniref:hypothetical protein n=1 Tax=Paraclostridium bifermentans TaxID=1490 RepID=UPI003FA69148